MDKALISSMSLIFGATQRQTLTKTIGCPWRSPVFRHKGGSTQYTGWIHDACVDCAFPNTKINSKGYSPVNLHWGWVCSLPNFSPVSSEDIFHDCERENTQRRFSNAFYGHLWAFFSEQGALKLFSASRGCQWRFRLGTMIWENVCCQLKKSCFFTKRTGCKLQTIAPRRNRFSCTSPSARSTRWRKNRDDRGMRLFVYRQLIGVDFASRQEGSSSDTRHVTIDFHWDFCNLSRREILFRNRWRRGGIQPSRLAKSFAFQIPTGRQGKLKTGKKV